MFDKTITIRVNGEKATLTNAEVTEIVTRSTKVGELAEQVQAKHDELARRLVLANRKLKEYGHISEF